MFRLFLSLLFLFVASVTPLFAKESDVNERFFLISSHAPDQIAIINVSGETVWSIGAETGVHHPQDAAMTEEGNVFFSVLTGAKMVRMSDKQLLWSYTTPEGTQNPVAQPLGGDLFLVGNEGPCRLLEIKSNGDIHREIKVNDAPFQGSHGQFRFCRKTPEGTYLFPMINAHILREYDAEGKQLREFPIQGMPVAAVRLPNGNTLAGNDSAVEEYDAENRLVWRFDCASDGHLKSQLVTAVARLKNGNTLLGYYHSDPSLPDIIEVSPEKQIVWSLTLPQTDMVAAVELLDKDRFPSDEILAR